MNLNRACVGAMTLALSATLINGATVRHDVPFDDYINYGDGIRLVGGAQVDITSFGSGTLIAPNWVLTAAHVVAGVSENSYVTFSTDPDPADDDELPLSGYFFVDQVAIHEFYNDAIGPAGGFDIALLHIEPALEFYPAWDRFRANPLTNPELGKKGTAVGFGATGTGITGYEVETAGFVRIASDNMIDGYATDERIKFEFTERTVVDPVTSQVIHFTQDEIASQFMLSDFDDPETSETYTNDGLNPLGDSTALAMEGLVAPGDSGGPLLIDGKVAGINSFITAFYPPDGDHLPPDQDPTLSENASYSDVAGYLRVSMFNDWIDNVIGVPEPTSLSMLAFFGLAALRRKRAESRIIERYAARAR